MCNHEEGKEIKYKGKPGYMIKIIYGQKVYP